MGCDTVTSAPAGGLTAGREGATIWGMSAHDARSRTPEAGVGLEMAHLEEISFLAEVAHLAATARTWDELMDTVIDRAKAAARADVCSLYLTDRDGSGLTLAATNGLDRDAVGVARLQMGHGITGIAAESRSTIVSPDVHADERFAWIRGVDQAQFTSMCSVPLVWDDQVVGVLNVQTVEPREFTPARLRFLETLAGLLAALVEKSRLHAEAEAQLESLRAIDEARANLVAVVTHALRTPLAVVRAYVELLGGQARSAGSAEAAAWEHEALAQVDRIDQTVDSILESLRVLPSSTAELLPIGPRRRGVRGHDRTAADAALARPRDHVPRSSRSWPWPPARCSTACSATCSRTPPSTRLPRGASTSTAGATATAPGWPSPMMARASRNPGASASSSPSCGWTIRPAAPASDSSPRVTWRAPWAVSCPSSRANRYGSQFVLELAFVGPSG